MDMAQQHLGNMKYNPEEHLEDASEAEFTGATLTITSDTEGGLASSREDVSAASPAPEVESSSEQKASEKRNGRLSPTHSEEIKLEDPSVDFFATRAGAFENALEACRPIILQKIDGNLQGAWLLTEIDHWDTEKERLVLLTDNSLLSVKYDFITLKVLDYKRLALKEFDKVVYGHFKYPEKSVVPRVDKLVSFVKGFVWGRLQKRPEPSSTSNVLCLGSPSKRRDFRGIRALWNKGKPLQLTESWNPWSRNIPFVTYTSHPLASRSGLDARNYDIETFIPSLTQAVASENERNTENDQCVIEERPIIIENYLGLASFFHNVNGLGFFKSRGRVSF